MSKSEKSKSESTSEMSINLSYGARLLLNTCFKGAKIIYKVEIDFKDEENLWQFLVVSENSSGTPYNYNLYYMVADMMMYVLDYNVQSNYLIRIPENIHTDYLRLVPYIASKFQDSERPIVIKHGTHGYGLVKYLLSNMTINGTQFKDLYTNFSLIE